MLFLRVCQPTQLNNRSTAFDLTLCITCCMFLKMFKNMSQNAFQMVYTVANRNNSIEIMKFGWCSLCIISNSNMLSG
jgi:hypothetical protein